MQAIILMKLVAKVDDLLVKVDHLIAKAGCNSFV
jgi:hypothetical protein